MDKNLCLDCYRICKVRNEDREIIVISCDAFVKDVKIDQIIQTRLDVF